MAFVKCLLQLYNMIYLYFCTCMLLNVQDFNLHILLRQCFYTYRPKKMALRRLNILQKNSISYGAMTVDTGAYQQSKL